MDNLALTYESHSLINQNNFRESLVRDILYYHEQNKIEKRDALLQHITEAETAYLIEQGLIHEIFGGAPSQRGVWGAVKDTVAGAAGGQESGIRNKLVEVYKQVWAEWINYTNHLSTQSKQQRGLGNTANTGNVTPDTLVNFFMNILKLDPKIINAAFKASSVDQASTEALDKKTAGAIIYKALQLRYQGTGAAAQQYQSKFQLPASL